MNERIEQLAVRAGATLEKGYIELSDGQFMLSDNIDLDKTNLDLEKFAELIVKECADIALKSGSVTNKSAVAVAEADRIYHKINEHFGVEE
jgi:hypothetical protein